MPSQIDRRALTATLPALAVLIGCQGHAQDGPVPSAPFIPFKQIAPFPVGTCVSVGKLQDRQFEALLTANFSQVTAEWQMKMETILKDDGSFDFAQPDTIVDYAQAHALRVHAHTLIWYAQSPRAFEHIDGQREAFQAAYRNYIAAVAGRYRGQVVSWDVVNEPVADEGGVYRECLWSRNLGMDYIAGAFHLAREADDQAVLFLNDYWLEKRPEKRRAFLRLAEQLLKAGAPLGGLGTQSHMDIDLDPALIKPAMRDLASLGLPIHVSELDVSTRVGRFDMTPPAERSARQSRLVHEVVEAFMELPARQRFALTLWGVRDSDSWLQLPPNPPGVDLPLLFDLDGRPKPAASAFVAARGGR